MENLLEIAAKTERKLNGQISEFNILRDRILIVAAYGVSVIAAILSFYDKLHSPFTFIVGGVILLSLISISIILYAAHSNPISRGMDTSLIKGLIENEANSSDDFFLHEISYNLDSFADNRSMLKTIQGKLNLGLISQTIVTVALGLSIYFNSI